MRAVLLPIALALCAMILPVSAQAVAEHYELNIPRQPLDSALKDFAHQTGLQIARFSDIIDGSALVGPITGELSAKQALTFLLAPRGLDYKVVNDRTIAIIDPKESSVSSSAAAPRADGGSQDATAADQAIGEKAAADAAEPKKGGWDRFRMAQLDQGASASARSVDRDGEQAGQTSPEGAAGLQEIVVTAQKRSENLSKVPISISAFDQNTMDMQNVRSIADIASIAPGVDFSQKGAETTLAIRGVSSGAGDATTGIYVDDVPVQVRTAFLNVTGSSTPKVFDLDRVEVLRGPQGTLFGAGAEGGAIRFVTPQPSLTTSSGYTREGFSTTEGGGIGYEAGLAMGGPVIDDKIGFRISAWHERVAGYIDHYSQDPGGVHDSNSNWSDTDAVKVAFAFAPASMAKITTSVFFQNIYAHDKSPFTPSFSTDSQLVNAGILLTPDRDTMILPSLKAEFDFGGAVLTSVSSYLDRRDSHNDDYSFVTPSLLGMPRSDVSAGNYTSILYENDQKNFSQELRLQSSDPNARLSWTVGAWFSRSREDRTQFAVEPELPQFVPAVFGGTIEQVFGEGLLPGDISYSAYNNTTDKQTALFGQLDYKLFDRLTLTAGVRAAKQHNDFDLIFGGPLGGNTQSSGSEDETAVTPKYGVSYQLNADNMVYASVSKGNRMGGANSGFLILPGCLAQLAAIGVSSQPGGYKSDNVWSYEIGSKNRLFNDHLQIDASVYHLDWTQLQQNIYIPACVSTFTANVGKATSNGFDLALNAQLTEGLKAGTAIGYSNARIAETSGVPGGLTYVFKGDQIDPYHAPWTVTANLQYDFKMLQDKDGYIRVDDEYRSKNPGPFTFRNPASASYDSYSASTPINPATNVLNLRLGALLNGWDIALVVSNLLDSQPHLFVVPEANQIAPLGYAYTMQPRTYGIQTALHW